MAYDLAKVTANGNNLIAQILANKSSLSIDKIEISDTQLPSTTDISTMTSVPKVVQTVSANGFSKNSNALIISTVVDNSSISADYKAWIFGIWGSDSQNGQSQLIAVITSTNSPDTIPAFSGITPVSYTYKFNIGFSNASQIQFNMIDDSFATNDTVVHTTGDETIDGQKKFKTDPTDRAGNAYAKTVDVNQQLDKKVNVVDMRKPASDVAGIEEVNAKQDAIAYTPADDSKVVHDNHDGTEQLNGVQVQPYNKLSDVTNLRNIVLQTDSVTPYTAKGTKGESIQDFSLYSGFSSLPSGTQVYYSYDLVVTNADGGIHWMGWNNPWSTFVNNQHLTTDGIHHFQGTTTISDANIASSTFIHSTIDGSHATYKITNLMIVVGSIPVTHLPAPEDKQDRIGYTPADDSKAVHNSGDETIGGNKTFTNPIKGTIDGITYRYSAQGDDLNTSYMNDSVIFVSNSKVANAPAGTDGTWAIVRNYNSNATNGVQSYYDTNSVELYVRMRHASTIYSPWIQVADDSKVAHLYGTNNFTGSIQHNGNSVGAHIQASKNDENSAISDSTKGNPDDIYYWTQD